MIEKRMSQIWVGDKPAPLKLTNQWKAMYQAAGWKYHLWTNDDFKLPMFDIVRDKVRELLDKPYVEFNGQADLMRWAICIKYGGWVIDADSVPVETFPDEWNQHKAVAFWENETCRPGLVAAGYFGCEAGSPLVKDIVERIRTTDVRAKMAWETVGPMPLTLESQKHPELKVLPARHVLPRHFSGVLAPGNDKIFADQLWLSTHHGGYEKYQ